MESKQDVISRLEKLGYIAPNCEGCKYFYEADHPFNVMAPNHKASVFCESDKHFHCTCDCCF